MVDEAIEPAENLAQAQEPKPEVACDNPVPLGADCPECGWKADSGEPHAVGMAYRPATPQDVAKAREEEREALRLENEQLKARVAELEAEITERSMIPPAPPPPQPED